MEEMKPCRHCGTHPNMTDGRYSEDGRADKPFKVECPSCGARVSLMPEYGEYNYWWYHVDEGNAHMRKKVSELWNAQCGAKADDEVTLKPCPFCGGEVSLEYIVADWAIYCPTRERHHWESDTPNKNSGKAGLIRWWNTRHAQDGELCPSCGAEVTE